MNNIKISVITTTYNSQDTIRDNINAILNQTRYPYEYIIVDGSNDDTLKIVESYRNEFEKKGINLKIITDSKSGIYPAMNEGISAATGDYIGICNSDDYYDLDAIKLITNEVESSKADIVFGSVRIINKNTSFIKKGFYSKTKFRKRNWNHATMFVSKIVYGERLFLCETLFDDLDFMLWCISQNKYNIVAIQDVISNFRFGGASNEKGIKKSLSRLKLTNSIFKKYRLKGYILENTLIEFLKYLKSNQN